MILTNIGGNDDNYVHMIIMKYDNEKSAIFEKHPTKRYFSIKILIE